MYLDEQEHRNRRVGRDRGNMYLSNMFCVVPKISKGLQKL
jgi:hypothetical protein